MTDTTDDVKSQRHDTIQGPRSPVRVGSQPLLNASFMDPRIFRHAASLASQGHVLAAFCGQMGEKEAGGGTASLFIH